MLNASRDDLIFSIKSFAGSMLALYIALWIDLPRPAWAMGTAYIVAQPLSGALTSKAIFRVLGTIIGGVFAVAVVPALSDAPELFAFTLSAWVGLCLYVSLLDRTPRSYVFMLAGYTAAIIGFPSVSDPAAVFDTALARVEEITLGIACATIVGRLAFPRHVGTMLKQQLELWFRHAGQWAQDALAGRTERESDRSRLASDVGDMRALAVHLDFEPHLVGTTRQVGALQGRMLLLMPILSSIGDRVAALDALPGGLAPPLKALLADLSDWVAAGAQAQDSAAQSIRGRIEALHRQTSGQRDWEGLLTSNLLLRLLDFIDLRLELRVLWRHMIAGGAGIPRRIRRSERAGADDAVPHREHDIAWLSALGAFLGTFGTCVFWWATAWTDGAVAAMMAAVGCSIMSSQDSPARALAGFTRYTVVASLVVGIYLFGVLPSVDGFPLLVAVLAPFFIPVGLLMARPATYGIGMALGVNTAVLLGIEHQYTGSFEAYINGTVASVVGLFIAALATALVRSTGLDWRLRRIMAASARDIVAVATGEGRSAQSFATELLDRLGLVVPRLGSADALTALAAEHAVIDLRIGLNVLDLRDFRGRLIARSRGLVDAVLEGVAAHYRAREQQDVPPPPLLLARIDEALRDSAINEPRVLLALVGLRRALFPDAPGLATSPEPPSLLKAG